MRLVSLVALLATMVAPMVAAQPYGAELYLGAAPRPDIETLPLPEALDLVLRAELANADARIVLRRAAREGGPGSVPALDAIATAYGGSSYFGSARLALAAMYRLGTPTEWFVARAEGASDQPLLARYALGVAAYRADSTLYPRVLALRERGPEVSGGVSAYAVVLAREAYAASAPLADVLTTTLRELGPTYALPRASGATHQRVGVRYDGPALAPTVEAARLRLVALAASQPATVEARIETWAREEAPQPGYVGGLADHLRALAGLD